MISIYGLVVASGGGSYLINKEVKLLCRVLGFSRPWSMHGPGKERRFEDKPGNFIQDMARRLEYDEA